MKAYTAESADSVKIFDPTCGAHQAIRMVVAPSTVDRRQQAERMQIMDANQLVQPSQLLTALLLLPALIAAHEAGRGLTRRARPVRLRARH